MTDNLEPMTETELMDILTGRGVIGFVGRVSGNDDMGFVSNAYPVTADGLCLESSGRLMRPDIEGSPTADVYAHVLALVGRVFHETYPSYGTGRDCADSYLMHIPNGGHEPTLSLGNDSLSEDADDIIRLSRVPAMCP